MWSKNRRTLVSTRTELLGDESAATTARGREPGSEGQPSQPPVSEAGFRHRFLESERFVGGELIGAGGMGTVVRAFDRELQRDVAIKVLAPDAAAIESEVERFVNEARITGQLEHPYIIPVYDLGTDELGRRYFSMRLVDGETVEETLRRFGPSRLHPACLGDLLQVFSKVCEAISFAHSRGVLHGDLKPSNVMTGEYGQVYVMDWGVARLLRPLPDLPPDSAPGPDESAQMLVGTPSYMAPEQLRMGRDRIDRRADVFALGAILYQMLTGQPPHASESLQDLVMGRAEIDITPPELVATEGTVPLELSRIALRAMANSPADRYASVDELRHEVEQFQRGAWHLPQMRFAAGALIVREGDASDAAYIIVEGTCEAFCVDGSGSERVLRVMRSGEVFGETSVVSREPRSASVRAVTDMVVSVVNAEVLSSALGLNGWMGRFVCALAERFREVESRERLRTR